MRRPRAASKPRVMREAQDFEAALRSEIRAVSPNFIARARRNAFGVPRLGIIAGRKAAARAVDRNRAKRLIREAFRVAAERVGPYDVAIQLRRDLRDEENAPLRQELSALIDVLARKTAGANRQ